MQLFILLCLFFFTGCQTTHHQSMTTSSTQQTVSALGTVTEGLTNQNISQKDLKNLATQVQKDSQTKSAVASINQALSVNQSCVKYCPVDGQRFDCRVDICPVHKVKLKLVQ